MTTTEILDYNKKCAEFLGYIYYPDWDLFRLGHDVNNSPVKQYKPNNLKFHSDWNWIMEVVEAIEKSHAWVKIRGQAVDISTIANTCASTKKEAVVQAIYRFLIWHEHGGIDAAKPQLQ